jgi:hypothetical protein
MLGLGLREWLMWWSACLTSLRPLVETPVPPKKNPSVGITGVYNHACQSSLYYPQFYFLYGIFFFLFGFTSG